MSASVGEGSGQEVDLNLAPIIDCFTVLITYLLVTASFLSLSCLDVGVSATGTTTAELPQGPPPLVATLQMRSDRNIEIQIRGGEKNLNQKISIGAMANNTERMQQLEQKLSEIKGSFPSLGEISVGADPDVNYGEIVHVIHKIQDILPKVYISG